ncbi:MAG: Sporulation factor SpoIIGA [Firmicutes bacterium ADurb.Bin506]|nr:MAG: Sporulation factor SpoIIGA [Firmicutes bacterium ADurb.Bin506]
MIKVYFDVLTLLLVACFAMDAVTLWAVAQIRGVRAGAGRIAAGASVTSLSFLGFVLLRDLGLLELTSPLSMAAAVAASVAGAVVTFPKLRLVDTVWVIVYRYLLAAMACGVAVAARQFAGASGMASTICAVATVLVVAEAGWGAVHRGVRDSVLLVPVTVSFDGDHVRFDALVDTGNRLCDPVSGAPAIIVELDALTPALPAAVADALRRWQAEGHSLPDMADAVSGTSWSTRFRIVPYSSVGREKGIMAGFRPDSVRLEDGMGSVKTSRAIVCVCRTQLSPDRRYRGLVNPDIFRAA